ncbi:unnamed protein product [Pipistrellus nathusii]|uniref:Uncharacterized protein n=1 Tax=Pipistrellus nathusii TaxID=59473 RepID=A0ABN9ZXF8_PIPNA
MQVAASSLNRQSSGQNLTCSGVGLVTSSLCGKTFQPLINIFKCISFMLCAESQGYKHLISHSRCVLEKFIAKPIFGPSVLSECVWAVGRGAWMDSSATERTLGRRWRSEEVPNSLAP